MTICSFKIQMTQISFQNWGVPGSGELRRSREELRVIYNDLVEYRTVHNNLHERGPLAPTPMNGKTWEEEKAEFWFGAVNDFTDLVRSGRVNSCEILTLCNSDISECNERASRNGFWHHVGWQFKHSSTYDFNGQEYTLDGIISVLHKMTLGIATEKEIATVNRIIDSIGTMSCDPRAHLESKIDGSSNHSINQKNIVSASKANLHSIT